MTSSRYGEQKRFLAWRSCGCACVRCEIKYSHISFAVDKGKVPSDRVTTHHDLRAVSYSLDFHSRMHSHYIAVISLGLVCTSLALPRKNNGTYHSCRALPGDTDWPSAHAWQAFNASVNGRLIATTPLAQPCHGDFYDAETCENLKSRWDLPWIQYVKHYERSFRVPQLITQLSSSQDPSSIDQPWFQNGTCDPFHPVNQTCNLGNLVSYSVNLSSAADVQASLKFAEAKNLRIVIKNTGHE